MTFRGLVRWFFCPLLLAAVWKQAQVVPCSRKRGRGGRVLDATVEVLWRVSSKADTTPSSAGYGTTSGTPSSLRST